MANDLNINVKADATSAARSLAGITAEAARAARGVETAFESIGRYADKMSDRARAAEARFRSLRQEVERTGKATSGGFFETKVGSGLKDFGLGFVGGGAAGATTLAAGAITDFTRESISLYAEATRSTAFLEATAKRTGQNFAGLSVEVQNLRGEFNLTQKAAEQALAQASRVSALAGRPGGGADLLRATLRLGLGSGLAPGEAPGLLSSIASGEEEAFKRLLGTTPGALVRTEAQRAGRTEESYSEQEKAQIRINALLRESTQHMAAFAAYQDSAAAKTDKLASSWEDFKTQSGAFIYAMSFGFGDIGVQTRRSFTLPGEGGGSPSTSSSIVAGILAGLGYSVGVAGVSARGTGSPLNLGTGVLGAAAGAGILMGQIGQWLQGRSDAVVEQRGRFGDWAREGQFSALDDQQRIADFAAQQQRERAERQRVESERAARDLVQEQRRRKESLLDQASLEAQLMGFEATTQVTGYERGHYGQITGNLLFGTTYGGTPQERAERLFRRSEEMAREAYGEGADALGYARDIRLSQIGSFRPGELTESQREQFRKDLQDEIKEQREHTKLLGKQVELLTRIANGGKPANADKEAEQPPIQVDINNKSDKEARLGNAQVTDAPLFQSGDSLFQG